MKRAYRYLLILLAALLGLTLFLVLKGNMNNGQITVVAPVAEGEQAGIYGPITVQFSQSMDRASVETHLSLSPTVAGRIEWEDNTLLFFPETMLNPEQEYKLTLSAGAKSANGQALTDTHRWTISIRTPDILYLVLSDGGGDLWLWDTTQQTAQALTETGGLLIDYAPDPTGERIAYTAANGEGGSDLRLVSRDGQEDSLLAACGNDYCSQPDWSPDGNWIAYSRQKFDPGKGVLRASRVWTLNVATKETTPLYENENVPGQMASFSPDGRSLATYDTSLNGIRILDLETSEETILPTALEEMGDWSTDGRRLLFIDLLPAALEPEVMIYIADLTNGVITQALGGDTEATSFGQPRWTPDENWFAVGLRPTNSTANIALWVLKTDGSNAVSVASEPSANFSSYHWDPWGESLVYQRLGFNLQPSVWIWDMESGENRLIIDGAARPQWLP
jgi:Tol biopolymer transport system component